MALFRYFSGVRLIKVSFKVNKGNKFGDFGYCPLNRGCPLNTVSPSYNFYCIIKIEPNFRSLFSAMIP